MSCSFENYGAFFLFVQVFGKEQGREEKNICFTF